MEFINIAIDGPAGAGKSTISKTVASEMGYAYIDTGAMFRAVALYAIRCGKNTEVGDEIAPLLPDIDIDIKAGENGNIIILNGEDVTGKIRTPEVSMGASNVGKIPEVRQKLLELQRKIAKSGNVVMDGRDIGTHVLPDAQVKIFLTASPQIRARRRLSELMEKGEEVTFDEVLADMIKRDENDSKRAIAPLMQAADAILVDTTHLTLPQSIAKVLDTVKEKTGEIL